MEILSFVLYSRYNPKEGRNKERMKDDRVFDAQMRARAFDYVDPWRRFVGFKVLVIGFCPYYFVPCFIEFPLFIFRSKTPKARRSRSRSGSYSSVSSAYSYSDR